MFRPKPLLFALLVLVAAFYQSPAARAQPLLPGIIGITQKGINLLSWTSQYEGIKSIGVQRSSDSVFNYITIGYVKNLKKGPQAFIDGHPAPGNNWYRLYIVFNSDLTWYSNRFRLHVDSAQLLSASVGTPSNDSLQKFAGRVHITDTSAIAVAATKPVLTIGSVDNPSDVDAYAYIRSQYVFTNPFTGHVNVEIKDAKQVRYSLQFYDGKNAKVLDIARIPDAAIIIDKRNFQRKGLYRFELLRDKEKLEAGYITIY